MKFISKYITQTKILSNFLDFDGLSVDDLIHSKVQAQEDGSICMICYKKIKRSADMRRHMRDIHLSSNDDYHCPPCNKYFKARNNIYVHIRHCHKDWKHVNYDSFAVKEQLIKCNYASLPMPST